ncbi:MAG: cell wall hydrolase [Lachnospiraceae bacterium]|nr:cell wall hydrolase [Lachnospiraceae bacterium]
MDYIKHFSNFKGIIGVTAAVLSAGAIITMTASNQVQGQDVVKTVEESSSDDGSAPGQSLTVTDINITLSQSATLPYGIESELKSEESTFLAGSDTITSEIEEEVIVVEKETEAETEAETEEPTASSQSNESVHVAGSEYVYEVTDEEYKILCTIVEAEAGDQDDIGRILVANVILNRVYSDSFQDSIEEVVFAKSGKTYQFSPTRPGGRYYTVTPDELTIQCVERALKGEDYSQGAVYFCMKTSPDSWFNRCLTFLFKHGDHYFYK